MARRLDDSAKKPADPLLFHCVCVVAGFGCFAFFVFLDGTLFGGFKGKSKGKPPFGGSPFTREGRYEIHKGPFGGHLGGDLCPPTTFEGGSLLK